MNIQPNSALSDALLYALDLSSGETGIMLPKLLRAVREHLDMEVSFISEFKDGRRVYRYVDGANQIEGIEPGASGLMEESYCQRIVDGRISRVIPDTAKNAEVRVLPLTARTGIRAYIGAPVILKDGTVYGTLCCYSSQPDETLSERDAEVITLIADITAGFLDQDLIDARERDAKRQRIQSVFDDDLLSMVYQPIVDVGSLKHAGYEALSRFNAEPRRGPDKWFAEAAEVGMGLALEEYAAQLALADLAQLPDKTYLSFNASSAMIMEGGLENLLASVPLERIVLEVTEHAIVEDYDRLIQATEGLRRRGLRLAVDDAGAGYASLRHILYLDPDIIKLDMSLTRGVDTDKDRQALASALIYFAKKTGCKIVAEGVETAAEYTALNVLGVDKVQGYYLSRPVPIGELPQQDK